MKNTSKINLHLPRSLSPARYKSRNKSPSPSSEISEPSGDPGKLNPGSAAVVMSSGSATGNPRNKCALQPGHSLMDWIRLGNSGKDLSGTDGRLRPVTPKELASHNHQGNAWIAIRGRVYNITEYMEYHPGGPEELMRGVGKDATQLFDQVHAWVNYESLLSKCLIGPLKNAEMSDEEFQKILFGDSKSSPKNRQDVQKAPELLRKSMESLKGSSSKSNNDGQNFNSLCDSDLANKSSSESSLNVNESKSSERTFSSSSTIKVADISVVISEDASSKSEEFSLSKFKYPTLTLTKADSSKSDNSGDIDEANLSETSPKKVVPKFDWIQKTDSITLIFYTKPLCNAQCSVVLCKSDLHSLIIKLSYDFKTYQYNITLESLIKWPCSVNTNHETGKFEIILMKEKSKIWNSYGITKSTETSDQTIIINENSLEYSIIDKWSVNHNTSIILVKCLKEEYITYPIGYHARVFYCIEDLLSRAYTPVPPSLVPQFKPAKWSPDMICFMVKKYDQGAASTWISSREIGDQITISRPLGSFCLKMAPEVSQFCLIAAGTGLTPMLGVIQFALQRRNPRCKRVDLLFFNRSEKDILWHEQLSVLANKDDRFHLTNTLSDPSQGWEGQRGHINQAFLINHFTKIYHEELGVSSEDTSLNKSNVDKLLQTLNKELFLCICGPTAFTQLSRTLLTGLGCKDIQIHCFLG